MRVGDVALTEPMAKQPRNRRAAECRDRRKRRNAAVEEPGGSVARRDLFRVPPDCVLRSKHSTEARSDHDVELESRLLEGLERTDLRERTRTPASENERSRAVGQNPVQP